MRTSAEERGRNRAVKSQISKAIKEFKDIKSRAEAESQLKQIISIIDQATRKNIIHGNKAARYKSSLMLYVSNLSG